MNNRHVIVAVMAWRLCQSGLANARPQEAIEAERDAAEAEVRDLERRARTLDEQAAQRRDKLKQRLRALYRLSNGGYLQVLASTPDLDTLEARESGLRRLMQRDLEELAAVREESRQLDEEQARRADQIRRALELGRQETLPEKARELDGVLERPVDGKIVGSFGTYKDQDTGVELSRRGIELQSRAGARVRAPAHGRVGWTGEIPGLGSSLILDVGNGYSVIIGRLRKVNVAVGDTLMSRQPIGEAQGSSVYLELASQATPIDPAPLLPPFTTALK